MTNGLWELIGVSGSESVLEMHSKADAPDQTQARRLLDQVEISSKGSRLVLFNPPGRYNQHCLTEFTVICPAKRPVTVRGVYSAVRLADLSSGAHIETTGARITLLNVG